MKVEATIGKNMQPLLRVENLVKRYAKRSLAGTPEEFLALDGVGLTVFPGTTLAVVGESRACKSTLAACLACLESPTAGSIWFEAREIAKVEERASRLIRRHIQVISQDLACSLNQRWRAM